MVVMAGCLDDGDGEQPLVVVLVQRLRILEPYGGIEEESRQERRQRSSLLVGG